MLQSLNELLNDCLRTSAGILALEERYNDIGCQVCKVELLRGAATNIPEKIKSVGSGIRFPC